MTTFRFARSTAEWASISPTSLLSSFVLILKSAHRLGAHLPIRWGRQVKVHRKCAAIKDTCRDEGDEVERQCST
ncbi:hypothetical protein RSAG8_12953, partial [Rhizoctonia solani AG-8 WAC10335]